MQSIENSIEPIDESLTCQEWLAMYEDDLRQDHENRKLNTQFGWRWLKPFFEEHPTIWRCLPYLRCAALENPDESLRDHLVTWASKCPLEEDKQVVKALHLLLTMF